MEDAPSKLTVDVDKSKRGTSDVVFGKLFTLHSSFYKANKINFNSGR